MANIVQLKRSSVSGRVPDAGNVTVGEPVVNLADQIIFTKNTTGSVIVIGAGTTSNITEGTNLYFSNARVYANILSLNYVTNAQLSTYATSGNLNVAFNQANVAFAQANVAFVAANTKINLTVSSNPPSNPNVGDKWIDSANFIEYTYLSDVDSSQWVQLVSTTSVAEDNLNPFLLAGM